MAKFGFLTWLQQSLWLLLFCCFAASAQQQQELAQLQQQIKLTEQQVKQQQKQLAQVEKKLQQSDRELAQASIKLNQTQQQHDAIVNRQQQLQQEQQQTQQLLLKQKELLAAQVKSAHQLGQHDYSQMLLNQQDAGKLERILTYYQYFNQARLKQLASINATLHQLEQIDAELVEQAQQLAANLSQLKQQQQQLNLAKLKQQQAVTKLQNALQEQGKQLDYLRQNEASLQATLEQLAKLADQAKELVGLTKQKGKLNWPINGSISQHFGERRQGGMSSRGILIQTTEGAAIKAIADGQVIYADWLKGYGWVIVLDHGAGFMSLYGHNQSLLKTPGSRITAGETIAAAGMSGGQATAGLYFEIRNKGEAVNPISWLSKQN
ncbi:murein hydrolase activator EnvC family protein [Rheinheimera sp. MMS21-TC3]|uniref:murein hydrolase activator EnvC family protein n=1 Tax=Rheinheimera sp. MMS21-TC3 TaxID=3072790 RepID=UPI0028C40A29|nr:peptidoglycan DD-metalloendopeptidase family protein [Rheinheimera sp. MMS21-TC3]WNO60387.1 peptidoglycan DD-metalloendopeptidase family protein [Rheinheimera sp. MMS21-TC3]